MKKNIIISVYNMEIGGIERSLINMLESFDYNLYNVDLLIFEHTGDLLAYIPWQVNVLPQLEAYGAFRKPILHCIRQGLLFISTIRILSKFIAAWKAKALGLKEGSGYLLMQYAVRFSLFLLPDIKKTYDIAISYAWPHDILSEKVKAGIKIGWIHTDYGKLEIDHNFDEIIWRKFDYIASVSEDCAKSFQKQYPSLRDKLVTIENIASPDFIKKMAKSGNHPFGRETFNIVSVGRLSFVKGHDMAVRALRQLHDKGFRNMKWYIVGYGGYEQELRALIQAHDLSESFILLGKQHNPYPFIQACDLYVQPSRYEGKAVTVTEAQILGKPVLITDYPTAGSQVENGVDGIICDLSVEGLVQAVERLYEDIRLRAKLSGYLRAKDFGNVHELEKLYGLMGEPVQVRGAG